MKRQTKLTTLKAPTSCARMFKK